MPVVPLPAASSASVRFENQALCLVADLGPLLRVNWRPGSTCSTALRAGLEHLLPYLTQCPVHRVLLDQRDMGPLGEGDALWLLLQWLPRATQQGQGYIAVLPPTDILCRLTTYALQMQAQTRFACTFQNFAHEQEAVCWLRTTGEAAPLRGDDGRLAGLAQLA
ncbi:hypothetical protein [Hymenobacter crusticola]|uniref:STAS/SEC14 domain-containing protein n=1 Tax=Hymenobacter crusticola TaxID=1770526 RepID=A0A2C9ZU60_9BACT|nr:hypothetical protein [Hymenobacter crusticola]OUJ70468.1 hypothetical protein BXP70_24215 [Hymenobacter crusticola]